MSYEMELKRIRHAQVPFQFLILIVPDMCKWPNKTKEPNYFLLVWSDTVTRHRLCGIMVCTKALVLC
jgi:hypothetical protein